MSKDVHHVLDVLDVDEEHEDVHLPRYVTSPVRVCDDVHSGP